MQNRNPSGFARFFRSPDNFFALDSMGDLNKGEVREYLINNIDVKIQKAAVDAGISIKELGWNKETLLAEVKKQPDHTDNLFCQSQDPPVGIDPDKYLATNDAYFQAQRDRTIGREVLSAVKFERDERNARFTKANSR